MLIETQTTPNANVQNFYFGQNVLERGQVEYADHTTSSPSEFLKSILGIYGVRRALLLPDLLFVEKEGDSDWSFLSPQIMAEIVDCDFKQFQNFDFSKQDIPAQIDSLIEALVRPFLVRDGGNMMVLSFNDGVLSVRLSGRCHGCPHANQTLQNAVEATLKKYILQIKSVQKED